MDVLGIVVRPCCYLRGFSLVAYSVVFVLASMYRFVPGVWLPCFAGTHLHERQKVWNITVVDAISLIHGKKLTLDGNRTMHSKRLKLLLILGVLPLIVVGKWLTQHLREKQNR